VILTGDNQQARTETCPTATLYTTHLSRTFLGSNSALSGERPAVLRSMNTSSRLESYRCFGRNMPFYVQKRRDIFKMGRSCSSVQLANFCHVTQCYVMEEGIAQEVRAKIRNPYVENVTQGAQIASPRHSMGA